MDQPKRLETRGASKFKGLDSGQSEEHRTSSVSESPTSPQKEPPKPKIVKKKTTKKILNYFGSSKLLSNDVSKINLENIRINSFDLKSGNSYLTY